MLTIDQQVKHAIAQKDHRDQMVKIAIEKVFVHPSGSPERWRAAFLHMLNQRPEAREIANQVALMANEKRKLFLGNKFAESKQKDGNIRSTMTLPPFLMDCIKLADPEYFIGKGRTSLGSGKHLNKMRRAFPEYFIPEVV